MTKISIAVIGVFVAIGIGLSADAVLRGDKSLLNTGMSYIYAPTPQTPAQTPAKTKKQTLAKTH